MNHFSKTLLSAALVAFSGITAMAQDKNAGVIDYEVSAKMGPRGGNTDGGDAEEQVITFSQHFFFTAGKGKLATERPDMGGRNGQAPPQGPPPGDNGGGGQGRGPGRGMRGGFGGGFGGGPVYVDLSGKKYIQVVTKADDSTKSFYTEEDFAAPKDVKLTDKTKKVAGYNCKKATVTLRDETYTVWYTQELPFSYSPINGLLPEANGVVLSAESDRRSFSAKKVDLKPVAVTETAIPANAEKISQDQFRDMRREQMQKFRDRQNNRN
ncbi:GLPGLI family protein [Chitinophaga sp. YR573]|uniref:GLPGLI family protein n=1 Tax=Chitinophaga sp. YR573 TaxID=1881040 RepID=UPI0008AD29E1|nr:GLPGLI family protein [Chitinophaga sp. YR573]SEW10819.1 GLPGLI family protein [Chitinophaga sp. YR573]